MREFLKGLGLDQETIDSIMAEHGKVMTATTEKVTELTGKVNELTTENTELKKVDAAALQNQIKDLKAEKSAWETEKATLVSTHQSQLDELETSNAIELAVLNSKTIDPISLKAHLDMTKIKYNKENKSLDGFEDQIKSIKEARGYLFDDSATGASHGGLEGTRNTLALDGALADHYKEN